MKIWLIRFACVMLIMFGFLPSNAQKLSGQWSGGFITRNDPWGGKTEYVLELEVSGNKVSGHSYTYFIIGGKRHYVICRLEGNYDKGSKSVTVSEVEKVKSNTPPDFRDLFQTHMLTYLKQGDREILQGRWKPYDKKEPPQGGETTVERRALVKVKTTQPSPPVAQKKPVTASPQSTGKSVTPKPETSTNGNTSAGQTKTTAGTTPRLQPPSSGTREKVSEEKTVQKSPQKSDAVTTPAGPSASLRPPVSDATTGLGKAEQRSKKLVELIEVDEPVFKVELYDNGQVDGDTISLFFNNRLMVSKKRLSTTPITLELRLDKDLGDNELVMFAENMGSIPPNTALMVVTVRDKRYEVNITSTEQSNGAVRFRLKE
jgi:hypothetical protein